MLLVFVFNSAVIAIAVLIHYQVLYQISRMMPHLPVRHRFRILFGVFGALGAHVIEVWIFGFSFFVMIHYLDWGYIAGNATGTLMDCVYLSFTTFSTLGYGDVEPIGDIRYLTGLESLTGLVLITWTASFLYFEMQRYWDSP